MNTPSSNAGKPEDLNLKAAYIKKASQLKIEIEHTLESQAPLDQKRLNALQINLTNFYDIIVKNKLNDYMMWGHTPATLAVSKGHGNALELLYEAGADLTAKDGFQKTPEDWAREMGYTHIQEILDTISKLRTLEEPPAPNA